RPWRNAAAAKAYPLGVSLLRNPTTGIAGCCPRARFTLAASSRPPPPSSAMNPRRFMSGMGTSSPMRYQPADRSGRLVFRHLSLPRRSRLVLGADQNVLNRAVYPAPSIASNQASIAHGKRLNAHVEEGCTDHALFDFRCSCQAGAEHLE